MLQLFNLCQLLLLELLHLSRLLLLQLFQLAGLLEPELFELSQQRFVLAHIGLNLFILMVDLLAMSDEYFFDFLAMRLLQFYKFSHLLLQLMLQVDNGLGFGSYLRLKTSVSGMKLVMIEGHLIFVFGHSLEPILYFLQDGLEFGYLLLLHCQMIVHVVFDQLLAAIRHLLILCPLTLQLSNLPLELIFVFADLLAQLLDLLVSETDLMF